MVIAQHLSGSDFNDVINQLGTEAAFSKLRELFDNEIGNWVRKVLGTKNCPDPQSDGKDVLQLTWGAVFRELEKGIEVREPRAWLYKIAVRFCLNDIRRHVAERTIPIESLGGEESPFLSHHEPIRAPFTTRIEYNLYLKEIRELVQREFFSSTWERRVAFDLFLNGFCHDEIDCLLGLGAGTSRQWMSRATRQVRKLFEK